MAISKIIGSGLGTINSPVEFTSADNLAQITLTSTDADANAGPILDFYRNSASPADADLLGEITFNGKNDAGQDVNFAKIFSTTIDASDGTEDGEISFKTMKAGTLTETLVMQSGFVGINTATPGAPLHIEAADTANLLRFTVTGQEDWAFKGASAVGSNDTISFGIFGGTQAMTWDENGICTKPNQPAVQAHVASTQSNIEAGALYTIPFATEVFDQNSDFNNSNFTFTAPVTGKYMLSVAATIGGMPLASDYFQYHIATSLGNYNSTTDPDAFDTSPVYFGFNYNALIDMDANDTCLVQFFIQGTVDTTDFYPQTYLSIFLAC